MIPYIDTIWYIAAVVGIALVAWLVRSFVESNPDSFLLNITFFAFAGQCVFTAQMMREGLSIAVLSVLLLIGLSLLVFQVLIFRAQALKTLEHYQRVLEENKLVSLTSSEIEHWATMLIRITGVDFYPEFYNTMSKGFGRGPRAKRRKEAISILPQDRFKSGSDGVTIDSLLVPPDERKWLWRSYAFTSLSAWLFFITSILVTSWR